VDDAISVYQRSKAMLECQHVSSSEHIFVALEHFLPTRSPLDTRRTNAKCLSVGNFMQRDEMRLTTAAALMFVLSTPAVAESIFPVSIPQECVELANREGVPTLIENKYQAAKAKVKLYRLSNRDPLVRDCKQAVDRMRSAMQGASSPGVASKQTPSAPSLASSPQ
jgi:hypothetical protein